MLIASRLHGRTVVGKFREPKAPRQSVRFRSTCLHSGDPGRSVPLRRKHKRPTDGPTGRTRMKPASVWIRLCRGAVLFGLVAVLSSTSTPLPSHAGEPMSELRQVYAVVLMSKMFHSACDQVVPQNAGFHRAAYDRFARKHSVARIRRYFSIWPNPVPLIPEVKASIDNSAPAIQARVKAKPGTCVALGAFFDALIARKLGRRGIRRLGDYFDELLAQAQLAPPPPDKTLPMEGPAPAGTPVAAKDGDRPGNPPDRNAAAHPLPPV